MKRFVAISMLVLTTALGVTGLMSSPASAYCIGSTSGGYVTSYAQEASQWASTCDGAGDYYGKVYNSGSYPCVRAEYQVNGSTRSYTNCNPGTWKTYSFTDSNASSPFRLCYTTSGGIGACGAWKSNYGF